MKKEERKTPKLRFPGFTDDWEQRKLNEVADFNPKSELPEAFEYVDLESVVGTEMVSHRTETRETAPSRAQRLAQTGDVFFQTVRPYQRNNYLFVKPDNNYVFSTGYAQMRPKIDAEFLMCFLQTDSFVKVVLDNCTGTSYPAINSNDLSNLEITLPVSEDEQRRIGNFITNLDNLITLHQRKLEQMQDYKKGMLQKMFPKKGERVPEVRFPGFTDDWEQRKLMEILEERHTISTYSEEYPRLSFTIEEGVISPEDRKTNKRDFLIKDEENKKYLITELDDIIYNPANVVYGAIHRNTYGKGCVSPIYKIFKTSENPAFMGYVVRNERFIQELSQLTEGTVTKLKTLKANVFLEKEVIIPISLDEQKHIGEFFTSLDTTITLHQRKLEQMKEYKKGLLQQMFV